jgi:hypothetical protein
MARQTTILSLVLVVGGWLAACTGPEATDEIQAGRSTAASGLGDDGYQAIQLLQPRAAHNATRLRDGRVLLTGGCTLPGCGGFEEARVTELVDPQTRSLAAGPEMLYARASGTATLLADGRVLLTGGYPGEGEAPQDTAEVYDPEAGEFEQVGSMTTARAEQTATLTSDGRVLIAGGRDADDRALQSTEWFDPDTDTFAPGPPLDAPRTAHVALVADDQVVLVGGTAGDRALASTSVLTDSGWRAGPRLATPRVKLAAVTLDDQRIFVVGGSESIEGRHQLRTTELVNLVRDVVRPGPLLSEGEYKLDGAVVKLHDGRVVIAAGDRVNIFNPRTNRISVLPGPTMGERSFVTATPLTSNEILVAGGYDAFIEPTDRAWLIRV